MIDDCNVRISKCNSKQEWQAARNYRQKYFFDKVEVDDPYTWTFDHKDHQHFVLYHDTHIIGYAHIQLWPANRAAIRIIVIDKDNRQKGFGKWFMGKIEKRLKEQGINRLHAESSPSALSFYTTLGYTPMPFNDPAYPSKLEKQSRNGYEDKPKDIAVGKLL